MELVPLEEYLLAKKGSTKEMPFSPDTLVFKVAGKMYALVAWNTDPLRISLKCDPDLSTQLRAQFPSIRGAYHMNKKYWSMIDLDGTVPEDLVLSLIDGSYDLVRAKLPKKAQRELDD